MIYYKQATITTTTSLQYSTVLGRLYTKLSSLFTGNNEIMILGLGINIAYIPNTFYFSSTTPGLLRLFSIIGDDSNNSYYSVYWRSDGTSKCIYANISSSRSVTFSDMSSTSLVAGTYSIRYFEKKHVV